MPVDATNVLQMPLPQRFLQPLGIGTPYKVGRGAHLNHIVSLQLRAFWTANQIHMMPFCKNKGGKNNNESISSLIPKYQCCSVLNEITHELIVAIGTVNITFWACDC